MIIEGEFLIVCSASFVSLSSSLSSFIFLGLPQVILLLTTPDWVVLVRLEVTLAVPVRVARLDPVPISFVIRNAGHPRVVTDSELMRFSREESINF